MLNRACPPRCVTDILSQIPLTITIGLRTRPPKQKAAAVLGTRTNRQHRTPELTGHMD
jgi:hypothetical protein